MTAHLKLLPDLAIAIEHSSAERCAAMLLKVTDLFIRGSVRFSDVEIGLFDHVITRLATNIEVSVRSLLAERLAPIAKAPFNVTRMLASDDEITVAFPILAQSERLDEATLVQHARTKGQGHLLAISRRKSLSEAVTGVLLGRGNKQVVLSTAKNLGARFSEEAFFRLVKYSDGDDALALFVGLRPDIPDHLLLTLLDTASEKVWAKVIVENSRIRREIDRTVVMIADGIRNNSHVGSINNAAAETLVRLQHNSEQPVDDTIRGFVGKEKCEETSAALQPVGDIPVLAVEITEMDERRQLMRQKSFLRGCLYFNNRSTSVDCLIRDISNEGARIIISDSVNIPDVVDFYIPQKEQTVRARVQWRQGYEIGLDFSEAALTPTPRPQSGELAQRVSQLETATEALWRVFKQLKSKVDKGRDLGAA
jgi:hypothetical protein